MFRPYLRKEIYVNASGVVQRLNNTTGEWVYDKGTADSSGHLYISYKKKKYYIHKMVAETFIEVPMEYWGDATVMVHHRDENKSNNAASNLQWMSHAEHSSHHKKGESHHGAKLTQEEVDRIREMKGKRNVQAVAKEFGVSTKNVYKIWSGAGWKQDS